VDGGIEGDMSVTSQANNMTNPEYSNMTILEENNIATPKDNMTNLGYSIMTTPEDNKMTSQENRDTTPDESTTPLLVSTNGSVEGISIWTGDSTNSVLVGHFLYTYKQE
jgi:hypothetical protein